MQRSIWTVMMAGTVVVASALGLSACGSDSDGTSATPKETTARPRPISWDRRGPSESTTTAGTVSPVPASAQAPTLVFAEDGTVEVFAGCNTGSTTATVAGTTLTFTPLTLTRMACGEPATTLETSVSAVLDGDVAYTIDGNQLTLTNGDTALTYAGN